MDKFSERLVALRKEKDLTQAEFARLCGKQRTTVSGYETEGKEPDFALLCQMADYFGVTTDYLLGREDERAHGNEAFRQDNANFKRRYDALSKELRAVVRYSTRGNISIRVEVSKRLELAVCNIAPLFIKASHTARLARCKVQFGARFLVSTVAQFTLDFCCAVDCYPPPPNSCSWVRDAVVLPITVVLLSCVGGRAFMIAPNRGNGNGFRASDCKIAEYNIFSTLLYSTLLYFVYCFAGNTRKCCFQCISARICVQNGISAPVILFFVVFWGNCVCCFA